MNFQGNGIWYINMCASWAKLEDGKVCVTKTKHTFKATIVVGNNSQ
jgi:hypothetical protein